MTNTAAPCERQRHAHFKVTSAAENVREARELTRATLISWGLWPLVDDACVIVSEFVTNTIGVVPGEKVELILDRAGTELTISVWDSCGQLPESPPFDLLGESGRGLAVVATLCPGDSHGAFLVPGGGKKVFARLII